MDKIKIAIVGNGDRASVYGGYVKDERDDAEIVAVVDPNPFKREEGIKTYNLPKEMVFKSVEEFLSKGKIADAVFNCTMDNLHVSTSIPLMKAGYDILLEKPITADKNELFALKKCAKECGVTLMICHLLRYTPFYSGIKRLILEGEIGKVRHMETTENVGILHASNSYIRGKWGNSVRCGSGMLLAKCCHDMDYICWLNNETEPEAVSSFGKRSWFIPENAPKGSGTRCLVDCPPEIEKNCIFSAKKDYIDHDNYPYYAWQCIDKEPAEINLDERIESLKKFNPHGVCAFKTDSVIVDHHVVITQFKNGSTSTHSMTTAVPRYGREIHVVGSLGEIEGYLDGNSFVLRKYDNKTGGYYEKNFDFNDEKHVKDQHFGGDSRLVDDFIKVLKKQPASISYTGINESINSHLLVYAAEESRLTGKTITLKCEQEE